MKNPFIVGDKIYLRPLDTEDIDSFVLWMNDAEVRQYLSMTTPINKAREKDFIEGLYKGDQEVLLGIALKEDDQLIGSVGIHRISMPFRHAGIGIVIGDKSCWSKGYGTEVMNLVLGHGFDQLNLHRIYLTVLSSNTRAIRAYEKVGFKKEGVYRDHIYRNGKYHDVHYMGILEDEWRERNGTG